MKDRKIIITDRLDKSGVEILMDAAQVDEHIGITPDDLLQVIPPYDALVVRGRTQVNAGLFSVAANLKVVGRAGVGVDNIDLAAANLHHVTVVNSPSATTQAVAEHALALLFSLARSIPSADSSMKSGLWNKNQFLGTELQGKTMGILGLGNIGSSVAQKTRSLGMEILGYDPLISKAELESRGAKQATLQEIYTQSDFLSIHVPLNPDTRGMIDGAAFGNMKRGIRLVCTARGGIIDETALLSALESGQVAAAALDVFEVEPPGMSALVSHPQVIATPHIGAQTVEAQSRAAVDIATEVLAALQGQPLRWKIV
jgi:D-3-phosphoglycerate dehydrogenase